MTANAPAPQMPEPILQASVSSFTLGQLVHAHEEGYRYADMHQPSEWLLGYRLPDFQRPPVWSEAQKIRFIESAWLGLPLSVYIVNRWDKIQKDGLFHPCDRLLIDGQQRLTAVRDYLDGAFPVFGAFWHQLDARQRNRFESVAFPCAYTHLDDEMRLRDLYDRMNFGGTAHEEHQRALPVRG